MRRRESAVCHVTRSTSRNSTAAHLAMGAGHRSARPRRALSLTIWGFAIAAWGPLAGIVPALTCLAAAWLLRSWVGLVVTSVVYVVIGGIMWVLAVSDSLNLNYVWAIVLPGVVLAALGTALGMYLSRSR